MATELTSDDLPLFWPLWSEYQWAVGGARRATKAGWPFDLRLGRGPCSAPATCLQFTSNALRESRLSHFEPAFDAINIKNVKTIDSRRLGIEGLMYVLVRFRDLGGYRHFIVSINFCALPRVAPCSRVPWLAALAANRSRHSSHSTEG
jgi:hypothetical protein